MADNTSTTPIQATPAPSPLPPPIPQQPAGQAPPQPPGTQPPSPPPPPAPPPPPYVVSYSNSYFLQGRFDQNVAEFSACQNLTTGYKVLDRQQPFYPGFYCLGAISSLGKTTFAQQMADQIAATGRTVLYFTLEQTDFELYSKSLARGFWRANRLDTRNSNQISTYPTPTSIQIRRGQTTAFQADLVQQVNDYIHAVGHRLIVVHGAFSMTVEDIINVIDDVIQQLQVKPVVIVDYLQIVAPTLINGRIPDSKTSIDHIVHTLKAKQSQDGLTVLAISSLNRQNYLTPVDFESFKESGGIEYTADVIWGLQLALLNSKDFYHTDDGKGRIRETSLREKRKMINDAKAASPRAIDLICLKNRYGISSYEIPFEYYPAHDYFGPVYVPNDLDTFDDYKL